MNYTLVLLHFQKCIKEINSVILTSCILFIQHNILFINVLQVQGGNNTLNFYKRLKNVWTKNYFSFYNVYGERFIKTYNMPQAKKEKKIDDIGKCEICRIIEKDNMKHH